MPKKTQVFIIHGGMTFNNKIVYKSKNGHFLIEKFPEIVKMIKDDVRHL